MSLYVVFLGHYCNLGKCVDCLPSVVGGVEQGFADM